MRLQMHLRKIWFKDQAAVLSSISTLQQRTYSAVIDLMTKEYPHLVSLLLAVIMFTSSLLIFLRYAEQFESRYVNSFSSREEPLKVAGSALSRAALTKPN